MKCLVHATAHALTNKNRGSASTSTFIPSTNDPSKNFLKGNDRIAIYNILWKAIVDVHHRKNRRIVQSPIRGDYIPMTVQLFVVTIP